jgi:hypothetical protein
MTERHGSCLCGKTQFTLKDDKPTIAICHCTHCQKSTSSAFSVNALSARSNFTVSGPLKKFDDIGESGGAVTRWFCGECGSPIYTEAAALPDTAIVKGGVFDDTSWLQPALQIYCDSRQTWTPLAEGTANFAKAPG